MTTHILEVGQNAFAAATINVRRAPGYKNKPGDDLLGVIPQGTRANVLEGPAMADDLRWWRVNSSVTGGIPVEGWVAETAPGGKVLLSPSRAIPSKRSGPSTFSLGEAVTNVAQNAINLRRTPGYRNKPDGDIVGKLAPGACLEIQQGPKEEDRLQWWKLGRGDGVKAWAAMSGVRGLRFLAPTEFAGDIVVGMPFPTPYHVTQWWGSNPDFYKQFKYDGVRLRGHNGIDFGIPVGVSLLAVSDGSVRRTGFDKGGFGHFVLLNHRWGESLFAHLSEIQVKRDQQVILGETIGLSGNTGASTGPHLHFGIRIHPYRRTDGWGGFSDPKPFMLPETFGPVSFAASRSEIEPTPMSKEDLDNPRP